MKARVALSKNAGPSLYNYTKNGGPSLYHFAGRAALTKERAAPLEAQARVCPRLQPLPRAL